MYDLKTKRFQQNAQKKDLKPENRKTERIFSIDILKEIKVKEKNYMVVLFDEGTISIYNDRFNIMGEFQLETAFDHQEILDKAI